MQLDKLQIELRPRPNAQALDLGFALLRAHARDVYLAWWAMWLPLTGLSVGLYYLFPGWGSVWFLLPWWLKPLLERATLYILSRQAFGENVTWKDALRAWPKQLGGGLIRLITWQRLFAAGRGLSQPIWQLEGARGKVAAERRKVIGKNHTARSAYWFGIACAHFEGILQFGLIAFIGIFLSSENSINPFAFLFSAGKNPDSLMILATAFAVYAIAGGIIGPLYTSCCFTLYLNRRATLEAWDIEIMLRQIQPPVTKKANTHVARAVSGLLIAIIAPLVLMLSLWQPSAAHAAQSQVASSPKPASDIGKCTVPKWVTERAKENKRAPDQSAAQTQLRKEVTQLFQDEDLLLYVCEESWVLKNKPKEKEKPKKDPPWAMLGLVAEIIKILLITGTILAVCWLLYRFRDKFGSLMRKQAPVMATEVGGLDIRAETLPDDVVSTVRELWERGEHRAALALLYRATLSRLVTEDRLPLTKGATEGDCLRLATQAQKKQRLSAARLEVITSATEFWLGGAYGNRWPESARVHACCDAWQSEFGTHAAGGSA